MALGKLQYQELVHLKFSVGSIFQFLLLPTIRLLQHKLFIKRNCSNTKTFSLRCVQEFFFSWSPGKFNGRGQGVVTQGDIRRKAYGGQGIPTWHGQGQKGGSEVGGKHTPLPSPLPPPPCSLPYSSYQVILTILLRNFWMLVRVTTYYMQQELGSLRAWKG